MDFVNISVASWQAGCRPTGPEKAPLGFNLPFLKGQERRTLSCLPSVFPQRAKGITDMKMRLRLTQRAPHSCQVLVDLLLPFRSAPSPSPLSRLTGFSVAPQGTNLSAITASFVVVVSAYLNLDIFRGKICMAGGLKLRKLQKWRGSSL